MNENIKIFLEKLSKDEAAQAKLQAVTNPDEAYELASSIQTGFTREEFFDTMKKVMAATQEGELSDEDVEAAAGGCIDTLDDSVTIVIPKSLITGTPNMQAAV